MAGTAPRRADGVGYQRLMTVVRWQRLVAVAVLTAAATWAVLRMVDRRGGGSLAVPWLVTPLLVTMAAGVLGLAWGVRQYLKGKRPQLKAIRAARTVALAAAASWTGALLSGWYGGQALVLVGLLSAPGPRGRAISAGVAAVVAVGLAVAGQVAQHWCRLPPDDGHDGAGATMGA